MLKNIIISLICAGTGISFIVTSFRAADTVIGSLLILGSIGMFFTLQNEDKVSRKEELVEKKEQEKRDALYNEQLEYYKRMNRR